MNNQSPQPQRPSPPPVPSRPRLASQKPRRHPVRKTSHGRSRAKTDLPVRREISAGGVAVRQEGSNWLVALLKTEHKRGEVWVLPKGHVELHAGERVSEAARREVQEEAGLKDLSIKDQLGITRFTFQAEDAVVRKTVHYFLMITNQKQLIPQAEEGLIDAAWFPIDQAIANLAYDTDQDIVARARERLTGQPRPKIAPDRNRRRVPRIHH